MSNRPYMKPGRLGDVLALIQVLALDPDVNRSEEGLKRDLKDAPNSADTWSCVALEHRELFRVNPDATHGVSLVARFVLPKDDAGIRPSLEPDFVGALLEMAITLHDHQVSEADKWKALIPLWSALIGAISGSAIAALITAFLGHK